MSKADGALPRCPSQRVRQCDGGTFRSAGSALGARGRGRPRHGGMRTVLARRLPLFSVLSALSVVNPEGLIPPVPRSKGPSFGGAGGTWGKALSPERGGASLSRSAGEARRNARFAFRVFRVPLAKPDGTLDLPFGSFAFRWRSQAERPACPSGPSPLQGLGPRSLTPPLAHSSPGSSPGSNAPNPLAGDCAVMPAMEIHGDLHFHFAFHRGIGVSDHVA